MKFFNTYSFKVIIIFIYSAIYLFPSDSTKFVHDVYLIKSRWHTGIILKVNELAVNNIKAVKYFRNYKYVDIGWGDKDFYQSSEDFDLYLAFKALFIPTESVVRLEGYNKEISDIILYTDFCIKFTLIEKNFINLLKFIDSSFSRNEKNGLIVTMKKTNGNIIFFKSNNSYHIFETCNKWIAKALLAAGYDISPTWIITADNLFDEVKKYGKVIHRKN